jgi:predicted RNA-binding protein with PIN domain
VARLGEQAVPRQAAPTALRPFLQFTRYPAAALDAARRVLDEDEAFRARVLEAVDPDQVGDRAMVVLTRPDGWRARLAEWVLESEAATEAEVDEREERKLERQLVHTREHLHQAEERAARAEASLEQARRALAQERATRSDLEARIGDLEAERAALAEERTTAVRQLKEAEERASRRHREALEAQARRRDADAARGAAEAARDRALAERDDALAVWPGRGGTSSPSAAAAGAAGATSPPGRSSSVADAAGGSAVPMPSQVAAAVAQASVAAQDLAQALGEVAASLGGPPATAPPGRGPARPASPARRDPSLDRVVRPPRARRRPTRLPSGIFDDTPEAVLALARVPDMLLLVDGYNVAKTGWPDLALPLERDRLVDALVDLQARTGVEVLVVFDGADPIGSRPSGSRPRGVQVRFSPPDVEADDVILELVAQLPTDRPVTVVSSDGRVRDGAAAGGANVITSTQLLGAIVG